MAKQTIQWHKSGLVSHKFWLKTEEGVLERQRDVVERMKHDIAFREAKIVEAERQGKTSFDSERFMAKCAICGKLNADELHFGKPRCSECRKKAGD